tara:strand:- start:293 stop:436 length:144 start_codon:yes stop_codon:yes gene_type:complete
MMSVLSSCHGPKYGDPTEFLGKLVKGTAQTAFHSSGTNAKYISGFLD